MAATAAGGGPVEVALVSVAEAGSASSSSSSSALPGGCWCWAWEVGSGVPVAGYRGGGSCSPHGLALLGGERLLGAQLGKSCLGAWELQRKDQLQQKIICPGVVTCLAAAPNGLYVLAGIAESIYLWEVSSGNLLAILNRHYQDLSCLAFTDDSSHFLSGAKDSLVIVWNLSSVLQAEHSPNPEPRHVWTRHSLPITDLCCGVGGPVARAATASLDQTAKLWEISSGGLLLSVVFDVGIMSVTLDPAEYGLFCGGMDGSIFHVDLCSWPVQRERNFQTERENGKVFKGHRDQVTCLSVSTDGNLLLSGSNDETVRLWDIQSKQCIRTINYKGPITNAFITLAPPNMLNPDSKPGIPLPKFQRHLHGVGSAETPASEGLTLCLGQHQKGSGASYLEKAERLYSQMCLTREKTLLEDQEQLKIQLMELEEEVSTLRKANKDLFHFSSRILTKPGK
ncbi:WD repeat-containing protein 18 isoform X2 [Hemicordylus capensis]|uniref:WD repeat-containing protein 18 isoform X2 n=1 Tax=Hemicordylus capensis TaxID=884348 RepID=UPI002303F063|nr:WD repeat-containing protein 18 isoform X2 [Hemicordylus capensis]XP_053156048.1 WD repeat-containing protein 18 isoform X2 [Hemicordylus capensis]XP_053156049.1 WD repeat-containing protein 18 isoform X2 [Hemicordylus capensis]